ncbi:RNA polymerase sigma factor [bacterium]|nr:RNA polymerase sigma factor [bacterium]
MKNHELLLPATDQKLIEAARVGDHSAFRILVERYESIIAATAIGMLGQGADAEDVGQETFIRFFNSLDHFRGDAELKTYLTRIAINLSLDALRKRKRNRFWFWSDEQDENRLPVELSIDTSNDIDVTERKEWVRRAISTLDEKHRAVVVLRMIQGYSTKETADILNIPVGTVLSRLSRAQDKLRLLLNPFVNENLENTVEQE